MGVDAYSAAGNAVNYPAIHRQPPVIFNLKKKLYCTDDLTYHMMSPVQCNGLFKNKSLYGMGSRIRSTSLQYTTRPLLHYTAPPPLHCTVLTTLYCTHYTAPPLLHCITTTPLHCTHCTAPPLLHCTVPRPSLVTGLGARLRHVT